MFEPTVSRIDHIGLMKLGKHNRSSDCACLFKGIVIEVADQMLSVTREEKPAHQWRTLNSNAGNVGQAAARVGEGEGGGGRLYPGWTSR